MRVAVLSLLLVFANAAPQFPLDAGFQNQPQIIRAFLLPVVPQIENRQILPTGAQIILLHPFQQPNQLSFIQEQPQGQIFYIQGAPQLFRAQPETNSFQVKESSDLSPTTGAHSTFPNQFNYEPSKPKLNSGSSYQRTEPISNYVTPKKPSGSSLNSGSQDKQSSYHSSANTGALKKASSNNQGSYSGYPKEPGQGGVNGYVTLRQNQDDNFDGNFQYNYETDHGIVVDVVGSVKNQGAEDQIQVIQGSYSYKNPDGTVITTTYVADENGFVAQGDHLPTPGPLPEAIAKSLAYIASQPSTEERK